MGYAFFTLFLTLTIFFLKTLIEVGEPRGNSPSWRLQSEKFRSFGGGEGRSSSYKLVPFGLFANSEKSGKKFRFSCLLWDFITFGFLKKKQYPKHKLFCVKAACLSLKLSVYCSDFFRRVKKMEKGKREQKDKAKIIAVSSVMSIIGSGAILLAAQFFS